MNTQNLPLICDTLLRVCTGCQKPIEHWTPMGECDQCVGQAEKISLCAESYRFVIATAPTVTTARQLMLETIAHWFAIYPSPEQITPIIERLACLHPRQTLDNYDRGRFIICQHRYCYETISLAGNLYRMVYWLTPTRTAVQKI